MIGHPKHVKKALDVGVDIICAQAGEGGGHTGAISASILLPAVVDAIKGHTSPLTGQPIWVVGAVYDGRGLAANLVYGAQAVWVGTRFIASEEAGAPRAHKAAIVSADHGDMMRTVIYTGRPVRVRRTPYIDVGDPKWLRPPRQNMHGGTSSLWKLKQARLCIESYPQYRPEY